MVVGFPSLTFISPTTTVVLPLFTFISAFLPVWCRNDTILPWMSSGVFTVSGILDSFIYHGQRAIKKKMEIGKFSWLRVSDMPFLLRHPSLWRICFIWDLQPKSQRLATQLRCKPELRVEPPISWLASFVVIYSQKLVWFSLYSYVFVHDRRRARVGSIGRRWGLVVEYLVELPISLYHVFFSYLFISFFNNLLLQMVE